MSKMISFMSKKRQLKIKETKPKPTALFVNLTRLTTQRYEGHLQSIFSMRCTKQDRAISFYRQGSGLKKFVGSRNGARSFYGQGLMAKKYFW
jgi:hypothetical protein